MSKRKTDAAKQSELAVRPFTQDAQDYGLLEHEHFALEYARLISAVHEAVLTEVRKSYGDGEVYDPDGLDRLATSGLIILAFNDPAVYRALARNGEAKKKIEAVMDASAVIREAFGLAGHLLTNGGVGEGAFSVKIY